MNKSIYAIIFVMIVILFSGYFQCGSGGDKIDRLLRQRENNKERTDWVDRQIFELEELKEELKTGLEYNPSFELVYFEHNNYKLTESEKNKIDKFIEKKISFNRTVHRNRPYFINSYGRDLNIVGHADDIGNSQYNIMLSKLRSMEVANYIYSKFKFAKINRIIGLGESNPIISNTNQINRAKNRRVSIEAFVSYETKELIIEEIEEKERKIEYLQSDKERLYLIIEDLTDKLDKLGHIEKKLEQLDSIEEKIETITPKPDTFIDKVGKTGGGIVYILGLIAAIFGIILGYPRIKKLIEER